MAGSEDVMRHYKEILDAGRNMRLEEYLKEKKIHSQFSMYLSKQFFCDIISQITINGMRYQPEVVRKIISRETKRKSTNMSIRIIAEHKKIKHKNLSPREHINTIKQNTGFPYRLIKEIVECQA